MEPLPKYIYIDSFGAHLFPANCNSAEHLKFKKHTKELNDECVKLDEFTTEPPKPHFTAATARADESLNYRVKKIRSLFIQHPI